MKKHSVRLEMANGYEFDFNRYIRNLIKTQDMHSWAKEPKEFEKWVKYCIRTVLDSVDVIIVPRD